MAIGPIDLYSHRQIGLDCSLHPEPVLQGNPTERDGCDSWSVIRTGFGPVDALSKKSLDPDPDMDGAAASPIIFGIFS